ncbi:MAG: His/Gly/Thr/Pro-type tRNA ligase C-terminal domain-containing protein, partial [Bacteroidia bacterium]|nr:His/Gly/Thr/Pro-type tRNA ligase C-terminal domain-containing protein [Bacteroidia bacterium]
GEDTIFIDEANNYFANREIAVMQKQVPAQEAPKTLEEVATPNAKTIEELSEFLSVSAAKTAKVVFYYTRRAGEDKSQLVIAVVRGDMDVNEIKLRNLIGAVEFRVAEEHEIKAAGCVPGYASPIGVEPGAALVVADDLIPQLTNLVSGANKEGYHVINANYGRDYRADMVADIVNAQDGGLSPHGGVLKAYRAVEIGNIFQLGTKYTESLDANFMGEDGRPTPIIMGSYGIGIGRLLACLVEEYHDEQGICLPAQVAPYQVQLLSLADGEETIATSDQLYADLKAAGVEVLYDDRSKKIASPGVKFNDADLRGMPIRITVSKKTLADGVVEWKERAGTEVERIAISEVLARL